VTLKNTWTDGQYVDAAAQNDIANAVIGAQADAATATTAASAATTAAGTKYTKPGGGIPKADLVSAAQTSLGLADTATQGGYVKPGSGVPKADLVAAVQTSLGLADTATQGGYVKPGGGVPKTDLAAAVQTSLGLADTSIQTAAATASTASTLAQRNAQANLLADAFIPGSTSTISSAVTITLTVDSTETQIVTGTIAQTMVLPTTSIVAGQQFKAINNSSGSLTVQSSGLNTIVTVGSTQTAILTALIATPTTAAHWQIQFLPSSVMSASASAGTIAQRNSSANLMANRFIPSAAPITTAAGTTALVVGSAAVQIFTGTANQTVTLPTTGLALAEQFLIVNRSTGTITVNASDGSLVTTVSTLTSRTVMALQAVPVSNAHWTAL
jgi:hypothetical protein